MQGNSTSLFDNLLDPTQQCLRCKQHKPLDEFPFHRLRRVRNCIQCRSVTEKLCCVCKTVRPIGDFRIKAMRHKSDPHKADRLDYRCRECHATACRRYMLTDRGQLAKKTGRLNRYGITIADYDRMSADQEGRCPICGESDFPIDKRTGKKYELAVDHCHATGKVRSLLCPKCNNGLGCFRDRPDLLHAAIAYLKKHSQTDD